MISAMIGIVAERGASGATVAAVVARAGVSRRTFYELFDDAEDCFLAAAEESFACARQWLLSAYDERCSWRVRMRAGLCALLAFMDAQPHMGRLLIVDTLRAGPRALKLRSTATAPLIGAIDAGRAQTKAASSVTPLMAEGLVGAALSVIHTRMLEEGGRPLLELAGSLMSMIVLPYLGAAAARRELDQVVPRPSEQLAPSAPVAPDPFDRLPMRVTYRTMCVLRAIAADPGASNRQVAQAAGIADQGQMSKLLARLRRIGLIANEGTGYARGERNAWRLTDRGAQIERIADSQLEREP